MKKALSDLLRGIETVRGRLAAVNIVCPSGEFSFCL
jgi:hypothetical protein